MLLVWCMFSGSFVQLLLAVQPYSLGPLVVWGPCAPGRPPTAHPPHSKWDTTRHEQHGRLVASHKKELRILLRQRRAHNNPALAGSKYPNTGVSGPKYYTYGDCWGDLMLRYLRTCLSGIVEFEVVPGVGLSWKVVQGWCPG